MRKILADVSKHLVTFGFMRRFLLVILLLLSVNAFATHVAVLETMADGAAKDSVSLLDRQYLTNVLREQAVKELPAEENFTIMTRENISAMLPPGKAIEDCEGSCLAETGRNIAADYICQARIGYFGRTLSLSAELYETAGNKLIASFNGRGADVTELLNLIEEKSPAIFHRVKDLTVANNVPVVVEKVDSAVVDTVMVDTVITVPENTVIEKDETKKPKAEEKKTEKTEADVAYDELDGKLNWDEDNPNKAGKSIPAKVDEKSSKSRFPRWVPMTISVAALAGGVALAVIENNKAKKAAERGGSSESALKKNKSDAESAQTLRSVGISFAIVGAVGIGLSIAF